MGVKEIVSSLLSEYGKGIIVSLLILALGIFILKKMNKIMALFWKRTKIDLNVSNFCNYVIKFLVYFLISSLILAQFNFNILAVLASFGASIIALSVVFKDIISDFVSGIFMILNKSVNIGDYIEISAVKGKVVQIGYFATTLYTDIGKIILIPNYKLASAIITRESKRDIYPVKINLTMKLMTPDNENRAESLRKSLKSLEYALIGVKGVLNSPAPEVILESSDNSNVNIQLIFWTYRKDASTMENLSKELLSRKKFDVPILIS